MPKSGKTILIEKDLPEEKIKILDKYLSTNKPSNGQIIIPDALPCDIYVEHYWVLQNQYKQVSGKYLGIWTGAVSLGKLHDQYGFTNITTDFSGVSSAMNAGFHSDSIMINLGYNATYNDVVINNPPFKYYFLDEPFQNSAMATACTYSTWISMKSSSGKLLISDYYWPNSSLICWTSGDGIAMKGTLSLFPNMYIMCDQYDGNLCGDSHDFWDEYKGYYGFPSKNLTNWMTLDEDNVGDQQDLLYVSNAWGMNPIWVYGLDSNVDETRISNFCDKAWRTGWLLRYAGEYYVRWKCNSPNPCVTCNFPEGNWQIQTAYYDAWQYLHY